MSARPLSTLDAVSWLMDRPRRPLDFTLIVHASLLPDFEAMRTGAASALLRFPVTASTTDGGAWTFHARAVPDLVSAEASSDAVALGMLQAFIDRPLDLRLQFPVRQLVIAQPRAGTSILATRFHHAAADGRSAAMWLAHQFAVAVGHQEAVSESGSFTPPSLRRSPGRGVVRARRRAAAMWHRPSSSSRARRWHTIQFPCGHLRRRIREISAFTYHDLLATIALDSCAQWNRGRAIGPRIALWLPVEIRRAGDHGFGNGTSRIRVHSPFEPDDPLFVKCRGVHDAISASMRSGEWTVPERAAVMRLPRWLMRPLLRGYLNRPWADVGSTAFSHVQHCDGAPAGVAIERVECVGPLHASHACAMYGVTRSECTSLTFTFDPALLSREDVEAFAASYQDRIALASRELACAG